jgi:hypothetical protein
MFSNPKPDKCLDNKKKIRLYVFIFRLCYLSPLYISPLLYTCFEIFSTNLCVSLFYFFSNSGVWTQGRERPRQASSTWAIPHPLTFSFSWWYSRNTNFWGMDMDHIFLSVAFKKSLPNSRSQRLCLIFSLSDFRLSFSSRISICELSLWPLLRF